jgi:hypothetical protein
MSSLLLRIIGGLGRYITGFGTTFVGCIQDMFEEADRSGDPSGMMSYNRLTPN